MALPSAIKLFINPRTGLAFGNFNGTSQITQPTFTAGDTVRFEIYLVEETNLSNYPRQELDWPGSPGIKVAVGPIDESPQAGTWTVSFGGDTTAALAYNIAATALASALNGLASIASAGGVTVSKIGDNYNIVFNSNGARGDITTNSAALIPLSAATVSVLQIGNSTRPQIAFIHLQRTVAGLATSFTATSASQITVSSLAAWNGSRAAYRVSISPDPKSGSFSLSFDALTGTDVSSASIAVGASAIDVQNALSLEALADGKVSVTQVGAYAYDITVTIQPGTTGLTANGAGLISFAGYYGEMSLNTAEAISLLDGANEVTTNLEVEITSDSKTLTVLQIPCILQNAVIDAASIEPLVLDTYLPQAVADGRYLRQANNLSDLVSASAARSNLSVYSISSVDTALALKANLTGATYSGNIIRDNGLGQTIIGPGYVGFSQTGGGGSFNTYGSTGITFSDATVQSTAYTSETVTSLINANAYPLSSNPSNYLQASALTPYLSKADNLASLASASAARTNLGLGSAATTDSSYYAVSARGLPASGTTGQILAKVNGNDYNAGWITLIPGDRYLTTSTTSNTIGNGAKTFTVGTGLSYTATQDVTIAYDANNHIHATVTSYDSGTGSLVVDANNHTGSGTYAAWTVNVGGTVPTASVTWGTVTGTLGNQTDLSNALNDKLSTSTAASTYAIIGQAVPAGGTAGQVLSKATNSDWSLTWSTPSAGSSFTGGTVTTDVNFADSNYTAFLGNGGSPGYGVSVGAYSNTDATYYSNVTPGGFTSNSSSVGNIGVGINYNGASLSGGQMGTLKYAVDGCYVDGYGLAFNNNSTAYRSSGITFSNGTTQTTAAAAGPSGTNMVWAYGGWYNANITMIYDQQTYTYLNVLTF